MYGFGTGSGDSLRVGAGLEYLHRINRTWSASAQGWVDYTRPVGFGWGAMAGVRARF